MHATHTAQHTHAKKMRAKEGNLFKSSFFGAGVVVSAKLELLFQPNTSPQLQRKSPAPRWSCKLVELLL
jgi:hypothetical protein